MKHFLTILLLLPVVFGACRKDDMCEQNWFRILSELLSLRLRESLSGTIMSWNF